MKNTKQGDFGIWSQCKITTIVTIRSWSVCWSKIDRSFKERNEENRRKQCNVKWCLITNSTKLTMRMTNGGRRKTSSTDWRRIKSRNPKSRSLRSRQKSLKTTINLKIHTSITKAMRICKNISRLCSVNSELITLQTLNCSESINKCSIWMFSEPGFGYQPIRRIGDREQPL